MFQIFLVEKNRQNDRSRPYKIFHDFFKYFFFVPVHE